MMYSIIPKDPYGDKYIPQTFSTFTIGIHEPKYWDAAVHYQAQSEAGRL